MLTLLPFFLFQITAITCKQYVEIKDAALISAYYNTTEHNELSCVRKCAKDSNCVAVTYTDGQRCALSDQTETKQVTGSSQFKSRVFVFVHEPAMQATTTTTLPVTQSTTRYTVTPTATSTPFEQRLYDDRWYIHVTYRKTWPDAQAYCESLGGHLAHLYAERYKDFFETITSRGTVWIGISDTDVENRVVDTGGSLVASFVSLFANSDIKDCGTLYRTHTHIHMERCNDLEESICEKDTRF